MLACYNKVTSSNHFNSENLNRKNIKTVKMILFLLNIRWYNKLFGTVEIYSSRAAGTVQNVIL